ncbi:WD40-repeat-containing domain protein [Kalaharituber pfeilii]|nr:WD40-repeat-containing domain protein [Kalaharituber pfeilii]
MTVDDPVSLILPSPLPFYHAKIPDKHWQLRSLLCAPESNVLYYPTGSNIFSLNTETRRRELVASLPFNPRCLGAKFGWVCAGGGNDGHFASIRVGDHGKARANNEDESVVMEMDPEDEPPHKPEVKVSELGGSIVNSITLHRPPGSRNDDDVLAILTNNDKTVRVFSLSQNRVQATLHLPISTNHASISPNGKHLVVVGDSRNVYFYHSNASTSANYEAGREPWTLTAQLTAGTPDALISTSFSPSSVLCAIASQDGSITIFDTRYLSSSAPSKPSPIVKVIPSSRPGTHAGAVRSVQFSPAPWDLLVWAEHSGRVTIADVRSNFNRRQIIDVLSSHDNILDIEVLGVSDNICRAGSLEELSSRNPGQEEDDLEEEAAVDEMEGYFRDHVVTRDGWSHNPNVSTTTLYPVTTGMSLSPYMNPRYYMRNIPTTVMSPYTLNPSSVLPQITVSTNLDSSSPLSFGSRPLSPTTSSMIRDYRERQLERDRARNRTHDSPRRRSHTTNNATDSPNSQSHSSQAESNSDNASSAASAPGRPIHWRIDYEAQRRPVEEVNQLQRNREQLTIMIAEERRRNILRRTLHSGGASRRSDSVSGVGDSESADSERNGVVNITGCTMSVDGSKLYVATIKGIVEYKIDLAERKVFPSIKMR